MISFHINMHIYMEHITNHSNYFEYLKFSYYYGFSCIKSIPTLEHHLAKGQNTPKKDDHRLINIIKEEILLIVVLRLSPLQHRIFFSLLLLRRRQEILYKPIMLLFSAS